ncbi:hypothetical protein LTR08_002734 [Meristemomyces frigidus]|nr:hypothetical protein LTR08_002734 [Meristemomyces frigidus]
MEAARMETIQPPHIYQLVFERAGTSENTEAVRCHGEACTALPSTADNIHNNDSSLMRMPPKVIEGREPEDDAATNRPSADVRVDDDQRDEG